MNQDIIEKNYYEQLMVGNYIDVKYSQTQWKIAKILEKDKRYAVVIFEGISSRQQRVYLNGYKVAPLRMNTEGYTGSIYRPYRSELTPLTQYKNHLEILQQQYLKETQPNAFTSTQYIRGELFVLVHSLLTRQQLKEQEANEAMKFLIGFTEFVVKFAKRIKKMASDYFQSTGNNNKYAYLINDKVSFVNCFNQLILLLNYIIKAENSKHITLFKTTKSMSQETIINFFVNLQEETTFIDLFRLNDGNGKWLSFNIHKHLYALLKKYAPKFTLPVYKLKDYQQVFSIYPFIIKEQQKNNEVQQKYLAFIFNCLKEQTSFQAKLRAIQELKKIQQNEIKFYQIDQKKIYNMIAQNCIIDHMLSQFHFNPQIFKRFTPILQNYCKVKSLNMKNIGSLFKLASSRHESQVSIIFQIIYLLAQFVQIDCLDLMYTQILKYTINNEQTINLLKNFTIKAIFNYSKQKSFLSTFFSKSKNSSKYGNYALDLFFKEIEDEGSISKQLVSLVFQTIRQIFNVQIFQNERNNYIGTCLNWLQKGKNYGQGVRLIDVIVSTYPTSAIFGQSKKNILDKLVTKNNLLQLVILGSKSRNKNKNKKPKISTEQSAKYLYDFLDNYYDFLYKGITIDHIDYLWTFEDTKLLSAFLKKPKISEPRNKKDAKQKYLKKIQESVQDDILNKLIRKPNFFQRQLTIEEFDALDEIFISHNLLKKKIDISEFGVIRYLTPQMEGYSFYFDFLAKMSNSQHIEKIIKKTINVFLRPKDEKQYDIKINTWKLCLLKIVEKLKSNPEICLKATSIFFQMIEGRMAKLNISAQGFIDIVVCLDKQERIFTLPKTSTIFKLRKQIMLDFNISGDFTMRSINMNKDISFIEEEQYSLNALVTSNQSEKGPEIDIINIKKEKHPQTQAVQKFKQLIQKEETFYSILFGLNNEKINQLFWKTIDLLPVNRQIIRRFENCTNFTVKQWRKLLVSEAIESKQYNLNIIHDLLQRNIKWVSLFYSSGGFTVILQLFSDSLRDDLVFQRIVNRQMLIIIKVLQTVNKVDDKLLQDLKLTLIAKVILFFKGDMKSVVISIESLNLIFRLLNITNKIYKDTDIQIELDVMFKILEFGVFKPTSKATNEFIKQDFQYYLINHFSSQSIKIKIYQHLLSFLKVEKLVQLEYSQLFFTFLIDFTNTFVQKQEEIVQQPQYINIIKQFVMNVLNGDHQDPSKQIYNHLLYGSFKLLLYTLKYPNHPYNYALIFQILLKKFLLNKQQKKVKHQQTFKLLYQCLKKLIFTDQSLIHLLINEVVPLLRNNQWRKNIFSNWSLQAKKQERHLFGGLQNLGATCYINCLIQQLFMIAHFRQNFMSIDSKSYRQSLDSNEIYQFQSIFTGLKYSNKRSINTRKFCQSFITYEGLPINPMIQSDADQFFSQLMQKIQIFLKGINRHDIIENTFEGKLSNQLNCEGCPHNSQKQQNFMSIGVNIRGKKALQQALQGYVQGQVLDGDNAYFCQICQKKVRTQKRLCIKTLPNILIIVLKRFQFNYDEMRKIKINTYLNYPMQLNMKKYTAEYLGGAQDMQDDQFSYFLRGTVIHSGTSEGGHYYSLINSREKWYTFNDEYIQEINPKRVEQDGFGGDDKTSEGDFKFQKYKNAYILFYQKTNPSIKYHKEEAQIITPFSEEMRQTVITQNNNADFLSVMLDSNFVRLCQNMSALDSDQAYQFTMLYFHTIVLRDHNKQEFIPNYYRIIDSLLANPAISQWYLSQINHRFLRQFLIQAPRTVRFICTSLVLQALKYSQKVPIQLVYHAIFCLKKHSMTPFAKIFKTLSDRPQIRQIMIEKEYPQRVMSILLQKTNSNFQMIEIESFDSYFGADTSQKQKQRQVCYGALCQSLVNFALEYSQVLQVFQKYYARNGTKVLAKILAQNATQDLLSSLLMALEANIIKQGELKRQQIQKYMFLIRYLCLSAEKQTQWKIQKCIFSLKKMIYQFRIYYEPMEILVRQLNYIASRNKEFLSFWKLSLTKQHIYDIPKTLKFWLRQAAHPGELQKSEQFRRKIAPVSYEQKHQIENQNRILQQKRINWMIELQSNQADLYQSDIDEPSVNREVVIRNKKFRLKQHLGLIKKIEIDGNEKWGFLEKSDFQICNSL